VSEAAETPLLFLLFFLINPFDNLLHFPPFSITIEDTAANGGNHMKKIEVIIRPEKLEALKKILTKNKYSGMTVLSAMGCGHQEGFDNPEFEKLGLEVNLLPKLYVMTVVWDEDLEDILSEIVDTLSTGNVGDGKVFISDIDDVMRIRTGERGKQVL